MEKPEEELDPKLMKTEKILREDGRLVRVTNYDEY